MIKFSNYISELTGKSGQLDKMMTRHPTSFLTVNSGSIENIRNLFGDKEFDDLGIINIKSIWPIGISTPDKPTNITSGSYILEKEDRHFLINVDDRQIVSMIELL